LLDLMGEVVASLEILETFAALAQFVSIVAFLLWFRRSYANLHLHGVSNLKYRDNAAVWPFFAPIFSVFRPVQVAWDLWKKSRQQLKEYGSRSSYTFVSVSIVAWWICFLLMGLVNGLVALFLKEPIPPGKMVESLQLSIFANSTTTVAAAVTLAMIVALSKQQRALYDIHYRIEAERLAALEPQYEEE
jgi:hypothetical protein